MIHLTNATTSVVVDLSTGVPTIRHWGRRLADHVDLDTFTAASTRPITSGAIDVEAPLSIVPEHGAGFPGRPGLAGHRRRGIHWSPRFRPTSHTTTDDTLVAVAIDAVAELQITTTISLRHALTVQLRLDNTSADERYLLDRLDITLPLPGHARELMQFGGRWTREMDEHRGPFAHGAQTAENRSGRTSHERPPVLFACSSGAGEWSGDVWGAHLAWSGNHHWLAEVLADGRRYLQMGELLHPGEVSLRGGEHYTTPELVATYAPDGFTPASWGFHRTLRERMSLTTPRPVLLNTWEAVYFDHETERLCRLADRAAEVGIERFVLDDGWFGSRRDDRRGLGDWTVSAEMYPEGLTPLIDHVRGLGMEFGIWVEPEMVSPDSDLYRAHPEWALVEPGYEPVLGRQQLVLNLAHPDAYAAILGALDALLRDHDIAYVKWDMNRPLIQGSGVGGTSGAREHTLALYALLDELRRRHPTVEIESCASGGGRIDHEILRHTVRVWTSDCNDALERQWIQRGVSRFITPEVMGAHIGPPRSHTTGRRQSLGFRAATAMFGHLGVEWNVAALNDDEAAGLAAVIDVHKRFRTLLHSGDTVRFDADDPTTVVHGVYASDRSEAVVSVVKVASSPNLVPIPVRLPGLDPDGAYRVERISLPDDAREGARERSVLPWLAGGLDATGEMLAVLGVQLPVMNPETAVLLHVRRLTP